WAALRSAPEAAPLPPGARWCWPKPALLWVQCRPARLHRFIALGPLGTTWPPFGPRSSTMPEQTIDPQPEPAAEAGPAAGLEMPPERRRAAAQRRCRRLSPHPRRRGAAMTELEQLSARALAAAIRGKKISSLEATR